MNRVTAASRVANSKMSVTEHFIGDKKIFECQLCGYNSPYPGTVGRHYKVRHLKQYSFHCTVCNKGFPVSRDLKAHMATKHGGPKEQCHYCNAEFTYVRSLHAHLSKAHGFILPDDKG